MERGRTKSEGAVLAVIEVDAWRPGLRVDPDEICPLVAEIVADKHVVVCCNVIDDNPENGVLTKRGLFRGEFTLYRLRLAQSIGG